MADIIPRKSETSGIRLRSTGLNTLHTVSDFVLDIAIKTAV